MGKILNALGEPLREVVRNKAGEPIILNRQEQLIANYIERQINEKFGNALGYEINITTLTTILKKVSEQKFFKIAPADYVPLVVGEGAWSTNLLSYRSFVLGDDFSTGVINTGANNSRLAQADAGVDSVSIKVLNWAKAMGWTVFDLQLAVKAGNWDLVTAKEEARKTNWDLGIQKVAFLGLQGDPNVLGLFNQSGITIGTSLTSSINGLVSTPQNLSNFLAAVLNEYRANNNRTAWPTHFVIPESDYLALAIPSSATYPIKSVLQLMLETFVTMTGNKDFKILPCAYGDKAYNAGIINGASGKQCYALLNYDEKSLCMNVPVDYTNTIANSLDNFSFQNVGYGQFTGVLVKRPLELLYYQF